jgi:hypothetical protein
MSAHLGTSHMPNPWRLVGSALAGLCIALTCGASQAASPAKAPDRAALVKALSDCRAITDPTERLACFDKTAAALDEAQAKGDVVVVDRKQVHEVKRQAFGFNLDALSMFDRSGVKDSADESITATVKAAHRNVSGKWVVTLDSGAVWRQIDDEELSRDPTPGTSVRVRKAVLGSFMMSVDGQPGLRVHRDE